MPNHQSALLVGCGPFPNRVNGLARQAPNFSRTWLEWALRVNSKHVPSKTARWSSESAYGPTADLHEARKRTLTWHRRLLGSRQGTCRPLIHETVPVPAIDCAMTAIFGVDVWASSALQRDTEMKCPIWVGSEQVVVAWGNTPIRNRIVEMSCPPISCPSCRDVHACRWGTASMDRQHP